LQKTIAFFDFDGTITTKDTMLELIKFCKGKRAFYSGMMLLSPSLIALKLGLISAQSAKEKMLTHFFGGTSVNDFNEKCKAFSTSELPKLIRPAALKKIQEHLSEGHQVVVVSASAENWVSDWCHENDIQSIATRLQIINDAITGKIEGANCNGIEKVNRIKQQYDLSQYQTIYCYGDTKGDKPMLSLATFAHYKPFQNLL